MKWFLVVLVGTIGLLAGCQLRPVAPERPARVAFMSDRVGNFAIYLVERDGSNPTALTSDEMNSGLPNWSGEAGAFAFLTDQGTGSLAISRMSESGANVTLMTAEPPANTGPPIWSPTGEWVVFGSNADIFTMDAAGENITNLTNDPGQDNFDAWSPDGQQLLFSSDREGTLAIYVMDVEGGEATRLTELESANAQPSWSPDGSKIAFISNRDDSTEIYVMDASGENVVALTDSEGFDGYPKWSPDGTKIAFLSSRNGDAEIYVMNADGSEQTNLTNSPASQESVQGDFSWSPDGQQILFHTDRDGDVEVYVMEADGSNPTNLTNDPGTDLASVWVK
jgi:Tol biopolymer transport system component